MTVLRPLISHPYLTGGTIYVQFQNGSTYVYQDVPAEKAATFGENASPGRYYTEHSRDNFGFKVGFYPFTSRGGLFEIFDIRTIVYARDLEVKS